MTEFEVESQEKSAEAARRRWLLTGAGGLAAAAGVGLAWWQFSPHDVQDGADQMLLQQSFTALQGQSQTLAQWRGKPLLINFWATWCPPCVRELPMLSEFSAKSGEHGVQVVGLAIDKIDAVQKFLARQPVLFPVLMASEGGLGLTRALGNSQGGLPFSILVDAGGMVRQRKIGELSASDLALWSQKG